MNRARNVARSIMSNWAVLTLNIVISLFMSPYVVNKLGSTYYGIWALTLQFTGYLYLLDFGVRESVIRYVSKYTARRQGSKLNAVLTVAVRIYVPITLICILLSVGCAAGITHWFDIDPEIRAEARWATLLTGLTIAQAFIFNIFTGIQYGMQRFELANAFGIAFTLLRTALIVYLLENGGGIVSLAGVQLGVAVVGGLVSAAIALYLLRSVGMPLRLVDLSMRRRVALRQRVFGYGWYVLVNNIGQKLIFASGAIVTAVFLPVAAVTPYAIAGTLIDSLRSLIAMTATVFNPLTSQLHALGRGKQVAELLALGGKLAVLIAIPVAVSFVLLGDIFIALWMGPEFRQPAGMVLLILAAAQIISAPHHVVSSVLYGISQHRLIAVVRITEAAVNLVLSTLLVQRMGVVGVALGMAIAHVISVGAILPYRACRVVGLELTSYYVATLLRPGLAILPFAAIALWLRMHHPADNLLVFFAQIGALLLVYAPSVYLLALTREERGLLGRLIPGRAASSPGAP
jgi:O-antigen/teichoic acid export membrane protein